MTALNHENLLRAALRDNAPNAQQILDKWIKSAKDRQLLHHTLEGLLIEAADTNIPTMVEMLVKHIDPKLRESTPLYVAASKGHLDCVKILLPLSDPLVNKGDIFSIAIEKNQLDCLAVLLPAPSGMIATRVALTAVHLKNEDALDLILQHPCILQDLSLALAEAVKEECWGMVDKLFPRADPHLALEEMHKRDMHNAQELERRIALSQRQTIAAQLENTNPPKVPRKI